MNVLNEALGLLVLGCKPGHDHPDWVTWVRGSDVARPETPVDHRNITEDASQHTIAVYLKSFLLPEMYLFFKHQSASLFCFAHKGGSLFLDGDDGRFLPHQLR